MSIKNARFERLVRRCSEVADEPGMNPVVAGIYKSTCEAPLAQYLIAATALDDTSSLAAKAHEEAELVLEAVDAPYRTARSAVMAVDGTLNLPDTLKAQPTDTDQLSALERVSEIVQRYAGQPWADALLTGEFGQLSATAIMKLKKSIAAQKAEHKARTDRARAFEPAWKGYNAFKRVVRDALGRKSAQYRRLHLREAPDTESEMAPGAPEVEAGAAAPEAAAAPQAPAMPQVPEAGAAAPPAG